MLTITPFLCVDTEAASSLSPDYFKLQCIDVSLSDIIPPQATPQSMPELKTALMSLQVSSEEKKRIEDLPHPSEATDDSSYMVLFLMQ